MITMEQLTALTRFQSDDPPILSLYLDVDPAKGTGKDYYRLVARDLLKSLEPQASNKKTLKALQTDAGHVQHYLESEFRPEGKGLAVFSCLGKGFWQVYQLPMNVRNDVHWGSRPYIKPLADILDEYRRLGVALVDKERARLFTVYLGEIEEKSDLIASVPRKHKQGGWQAADLQRRHETHVLWHLKDAAETLAKLDAEAPFDGLILGGPAEPLNEFQRLLPKSLSERLVTTISLAVTADSATVRKAALAVEEQRKRAAEERLLDNLLTTAQKKGGQAALGLADTLFALQQGRVHRLLTADGYTAPGFQCRNCGLLTAQAVAVCPSCGQKKIEAIPDAINRAMHIAIEQGSAVEVFRGKAAERLKAAGGVGAILRY